MIDLKFAAEIFQKAGKIEEYQKIISLIDDSLRSREKIEELKKEVKKLEKENKELFEKLNLQDDLEFRNNAYWKKSDGDGPFCQPCWDDKNKLIRITLWGRTDCKCSVCNNIADKVINN